MASRTATLAVKVTADAAGAARELDNVGSSAGKFQSGINKAAGVAAAGGLALAAFGKQAFDAASTAQQASGAVDAAFGKSAGAIHKFAQTSAQDVGLASSEYEGMAATFGAQLKNMGVSAKDLAPTTDDLIGMGADLAAQFGGDTSEAVAALSSLLRGETDPIERYGVSIKQADIAAKQAEMGMAGLTGEAAKQAKIQATLALLTEQTADATGAFARESDTAAGQQQRANAQYKNATAAIGKALLPVVSKAAELFAKMGKFVQDNASVFQKLGFVLAGVATAVLAVKAATMAWHAAQMVAKAATIAWSAAQWLLNAAMTANPIGLIVAGIAALVAGIILVVKNWDKVTAAFRWFWDWIKKNWPTLLAIITGPFGLAVLFIVKKRDKILAVFRKVLDVAKAVFRKVKDIAKAVFNAIASVVKTVFGRIADIFRRARETASNVFRAIRDVARTVFNAIRDVVRSVASTITNIFRNVREILSNVFRAVREVARTVFNAIRDVARTIADAIKTAFRVVRDVLQTAFRAVRDTARTVFEGIKGFVQWPIDKINDLIDLVEGAASDVWDTMSDAADTALDAIIAPINAVKDAIGWLIDKVNALLGVLGDIHFPSVPSWVPIVGGSSAPAPAGTRAPTVGTRSGPVGMSARSTTGPGLTINVNGALDPDAVARQIQRLLTQRSRRVGGVARTAGVL